jgi:hypothetical protein
MTLSLIAPNNENQKKDAYYFTISAPGSLVGATVSAIVYTTLSTTGDVAAAVTGTGIELGGNLLAYGTELAIGSIPAHTVRMTAKTYGAVIRPAISNTSRLGALGISLLAGAGAALTTSAVIYGGQRTGAYLYSFIEDYKQKVAMKIQYPIESKNYILQIDDDIQIIEDKDPKHSQQDEPVAEKL